MVRDMWGHLHFTFCNTYTQRFQGLQKLLRQAIKIFSDATFSTIRSKVAITLWIPDRLIHETVRAKMY